MTDTKIALGTSFILWIFFFLAVFFIPLPVAREEKKEFGEVSIRLDPLPQRAESASSALTAQSSTRSQAPSATAPSAPEVVAVPTEVAAPQQTSSQATQTPPEPISPTPTTERSQTLAKSIDDLIAEQAAASQNEPEAVWDDSLFADSSTTSSSSSSSNATNNSRTDSSSLSGSIARATTNSTSEGTVAEGQREGQSNAVNNTASDDTIEALENIGSTTNLNATSRNSTSTSDSDASVATTSSIAQGSPSGLDISFVGANRRLIRPAVPVLTISAENQGLIDSSRQLNISFNVSASGNVSPSNIVFTPSALLPPVIQSELREQISQWQFEPGPSSGQASFIYSINKG